MCRRPEQHRLAIEGQRRTALFGPVSQLECSIVDNPQMGCQARRRR
jgi:hypothetical protein